MLLKWSNKHNTANKHTQLDCPSQFLYTQANVIKIKITFYRFSFPGTTIPGVSRNTCNQHDAAWESVYFLIYGTTRTMESITWVERVMSSEESAGGYHYSWLGQQRQHGTQTDTICTQTMEQSSVAPERRWHILLWIPAVAKDISVWIVGPRRSVNCFNCAN